jgi:hypothetical protein
VRINRLLSAALAFSSMTGRFPMCSALIAAQRVHSTAVATRSGDLVALRGEPVDARVVITMSSRHINISGNIVQQRTSLRQASAQSLHETLKSFPSLGLGGRLRICRELRRHREPEANE